MILIELDRPRHLKLSINAIADAERLEGRNLTHLLAEGGISASRALLWAGLKWEDRTLTPEKVGDLMEEWIQTKPYSEIGEKISEALKEQAWFKVVKEESERGESRGGSPPDT